MKLPMMTHNHLSNTPGQTATLPVKVSTHIVRRGKSHTVYVCVCERERREIDTKVAATVALVGNQVKQVARKTHMPTSDISYNTWLTLTVSLTGERNRQLLWHLSTDIKPPLMLPTAS